MLSWHLRTNIKVLMDYTTNSPFCKSASNASEKRHSRTKAAWLYLHSGTINKYQNKTHETRWMDAFPKDDSTGICITNKTVVEHFISELLASPPSASNLLLMGSSYSYKCWEDKNLSGEIWHLCFFLNIYIYLIFKCSFYVPYRWEMQKLHQPDTPSSSR